MSDLDTARDTLAAFGIHPSADELAVLARDMEYYRTAAAALYQIPGVDDEEPAIGFTPEDRLGPW